MYAGALIIMISIATLARIYRNLHKQAPAKMLLEWSGMRIDVAPQDVRVAMRYMQGGAGVEAEHVCAATVEDFDGTIPRVGDIAIYGGEAVSVSYVSHDAARVGVIIGLVDIGKNG